MHHVVIIEDHPVVIAGLKNLFRPSRDVIKIAGQFATPAELLHQSTTDRYDLIILDLYIPGTEYIDNIKQLRARFPQTPILIYTSEERATILSRALEAGATAVCRKSTSTTELRRLIDEIINGSVMHLGSITLKPEKHQKPSLQELEILLYLQQGYSQSDIGQLIKKSQSSVEKTVGKLKTRYDAINQAQLIVFAVSQGWI